MFLRSLSAVALLLVAVSGCAASGEAPAASGPVVPQSEDEKTLYALGLVVAQNLSGFSLSEEEMRFVEAGIEAGLLGAEPAVSLDEYGPKIQGLAQTRAQAAAEVEKVAGRDALAELAATPGAVSSDSGLVFLEVAAGDGKTPKITDRVRAHYHGTLRDGTVFDSSVERGTPILFTLQQVIPCWGEALQKMKENGKARIGCPSDIAYGDQGRPPAIPGGASLIFDVELIEVLPEEG